MAAVAQLAAHTTPIEISAPALCVAAGLLALVICLTVFTERPLANETEAVSAPAAMMVTSLDPSVPAARSDDNALPDEQAPTF